MRLLCLGVFFQCFRFLWLNLAQMSLMGKPGITRSAFGAQKAVFLWSMAHTDVQPCFSFLNLRLQAQFYAGLSLSTLLRRCQPNFGWLCGQEECFSGDCSNFSQSHSVALLFFNSLPLFGSWGTTVHLPVLHSNIYSMGKVIIFFVPSPVAVPVWDYYTLPLQSCIHSRATATAVDLGPYLWGQ